MRPIGLQRLGVTGALYRTLRSTNAIENLNGLGASASSPKAGAGCGNAARPDLCRGLRVTVIPTATGHASCARRSVPSLRPTISIFDFGISAAVAG